MIAVIFEVEPKDGALEEYLAISAELRAELEQIEGFISVERFQSLTNSTKYLSLSFFEDEEAVKRWRTLAMHRRAQARGRHDLFRDYRLRVAAVVRDYGLVEREAVPDDSKRVHH